MKKIIALFLGLLIISPPTFADSTSLVPVKVEANQQYTFKTEGWYFTKEAEVFLRQRLVERDAIQKQLTLTQDSNSKLQENVKLQEQISEKYRKTWLETEDELTKYLKQENRSKFWYIVLGGALVVASGLAIGYAAKAIK